LTTARESISQARCAMSYDTTLNDAIDPPASCLPARERAISRTRIAMATMAIVVALASLLYCGWLLLR
jgi:hypothetical protein